MCTSMSYVLFFHTFFLTNSTFCDTFHSLCNPDLIDICASEKIGPPHQMGVQFFTSICIPIPLLIYFTKKL